MASPEVSARVHSASPDEQHELAEIVDLFDHINATGDRKTKLVGPNGEQVILPAPAFDALNEIVRGMAQGMTMTLIPTGHEVTTQQAADILRVSRPTVIRLLDAGAIGFHMVGTHRRMQIEDVLNYRAERAARRRVALRELTERSEELGYE